MEYECPDPFPRIRRLPEGVVIRDAWCIMGYVVLDVSLTRGTSHHDSLVFYNLPGAPGFNFISVGGPVAFEQFKQSTVKLLNDPQYGPGYIDYYFKDKARNIADEVRRGIKSYTNLYWNLPGGGY